MGSGTGLLAYGIDSKIHFSLLSLKIPPERVPIKIFPLSSSAMVEMWLLSIFPSFTLNNRMAPLLLSYMQSPWFSVPIHS